MLGLFLLFAHSVYKSRYKAKWSELIKVVNTRDISPKCIYPGGYVTRNEYKSSAHRISTRWNVKQCDILETPKFR